MIHSRLLSLALMVGLAGCLAGGGNAPPPGSSVQWKTESKVVAGLSVKITDAGNDRMTCILVHGLGFKGGTQPNMLNGYFNNQGLDQLLRDAGYNTVLIDLTGAGNSPKATDGNTITLGLQVEGLDVTVKQLRQQYSRLVLIGHSIGARLSTEVFSRNPSLYAGVAALGWHPYAQRPTIDQQLLGKLLNSPNGYADYRTVEVLPGLDAQAAFFYYPGTDPAYVKIGHDIGELVPVGALRNAFDEFSTMEALKILPWSENLPSGKVYNALYTGDLIYGKTLKNWPHVVSERFGGGHANELQPDFRDDARESLLVWLKAINDTQS